MESEEEGDGVGSAGDGDADAVSGVDVFAGEGKHEVMLLCPVCPAGRARYARRGHFVASVPCLAAIR